VTTIYDFSAENNKNETIPLSDYANKVVLVVNTASHCGFTPQYEGLQTLYSNLNAKGLEILGFPCNQFKQQESGTNQEIKDFCDLQFNISFPLFNKVEVNGDSSHPLFSYLKQEAPGLFGSKSIKWNFTKFLINREGEVVKRYAPLTKPEKIASDIEKLL
jgi:glutathione peroxidase